MKIENTSPGQQAISRTGPATEKTTGPSFADFLHKELQAADQIRPGNEITPATAVAGIPASLRLDSLSLTENTIATLEHFSSALANPSFHSKDLEPYASALEEESAALVELKNHLPAGTPLASLLERVATVSYLEAAKYRRGDYSD